MPCRRALAELVLVMVMTAASVIKPLQAQAPADTTPAVFEVASIKENDTGDGRFSMETMPNRGFAASNVTLRALIMEAFGIQSYQITGGPEWIDSRRFDIAAKTAGPASEGELRLMVRALLAERFGLRVHNERREGAIYSLTFARTDRQLGPNLEKSLRDCAAEESAGPRPTNVPKPQLPCGLNEILGMKSSVGGGGRTLSEIATALGNVAVPRPVVDATGLDGVFDFELRWVPDVSVVGNSQNGEAVSIFTAVQEQLGLKLEPARGQVAVLVIDAVSLPTPN